jgi:T5SS/PEP-CTERM-associated repeat protein
MRHFYAARALRATRTVGVWLALLAAISVAVQPPSVLAAITPQGDVDPADPTTWTDETTGYVGKTSSGTVTVKGGSKLLSGYAYLGYDRDASGVASLEDAGWVSSNEMYVGYSGCGTLSVVHHSAVGTSFSAYVNSSTAYIGYNAGSSGAVTLDDASWTCSGSFGLHVGFSGCGTLNVTNDSTVNSMFATIGYNAGSSGTATVDGTGSRLTVSELLDVGVSGDGMLKITSGAAVSCPHAWLALYAGSSGTAIVDGAYSKLTSDNELNIGCRSSATLEITNGGAVSNVYGRIGEMAGASGTVTVDGAGSSWRNALSLSIGTPDSNGSLVISNGGAVSAGDTTVGHGSASAISFGSGGGTLTTATLVASPSQLCGAGTIDANGLLSDFNLTFDASASCAVPFGTGGIMTLEMSGTASTGALGAGYAGAAALTIQNRANVCSNQGYLGYYAGSSGTATVDGAGSKWTSSGSMIVGLSGSGTLNIVNGGTVSSTNGYVGQESGSSGTVTVDGAGSIWSNSGGLYVGGAGSRGTLNISNGGVVSVGASASVGNGTLNISNGGAVSVGATTSVSSPAGTISFGPGGGTLTTITLCAALTQLKGAGTINSKGLLGDVDLTFDASGSCSMPFGTGGVLTVDMSASGNGDLAAGYVNSAQLTVKNGASIYSNHGILGYNAGSSGAAEVAGAGSKWTTGTLYVGLYGSGALKIAGGTVSSFSAYINYGAGSSGTVTVDGAGSTWSTNGGCLYVGASGPGTLNVTNGGAISGNSTGYIGGDINSLGTATVDGPGSKWTSSRELYVGASGTGTLRIVGGGTVANSIGYIGHYTGSSGTAIVDGVGSTWTNNNLIIGNSGGGTLSITGGGTATTRYAMLNSTSLLAIDVGRGSSLAIAGGTGTLDNRGTVRILAGAAIPVNDSVKYSPIFGRLSGTGTLQPIGGTWDKKYRQFTASSVIEGMSGSSVPLDLASVQRALITYDRIDVPDWLVGASFPAAGTTTDITFTAAAVSGGLLDALNLAVGDDRGLLGGWTFSTTGYTVSPSMPVYFSFKVGAGKSLDTLDLWICNDGTWSAYTPMDLTYDGSYASFTATSLPGFAVSCPSVPEPHTLALVAMGVVSLLGYAWRRRRAS